MALGGVAMKAWLVAIAWLVAGEVKMRTHAGVEYTLLDKIRGSGIDRREYRLLRLTNQMEVLVGRDEQYDKSIVVLDVRVGFRQEAPKRRGTMHLYEHILNTNGFKAHIARNMGYSNAETSYEHTNYHFTVASKSLNKSLKIFSSILKRPRFDVNHLELDVGVVDQEFRDELQNDAFRLEKVSRITGKQHHSHTSYFGGNNATLGSIDCQTLQASLQEIYNSQYSSHRMRLVVIGSAPFNHQIETIVNNFSSIPKTSLGDIREGDPFQNEPQTTQITASTVKDQNTLLMQFHMQPLHAFLKSKSAEYIAYMLSQSNDGSILALFKKMGWAFYLKCGVARSYSEFSLFNIEITLTPRGLYNTLAMVETVMQAIDLIKAEGLQQHYFDEMVKTYHGIKVSLLQDHPLDHAIEIANLMHYRKATQILDFESEIEFQPQNITRLLDQMSLKNLRVMVSHQSASTDKVEPVYGTNYSVTRIDLQNAPAAGIHWDLQLPSENPFLGDGTEVMQSDLPQIYTTSLLIPQRILMDQSGEMWALPVESAKSVLFFSTTLPKPITLEEFVKVELFSSIKFESLGEMNYHLSKAGNYYSVEVKEDGWEVNIFGFNKNIPRIVEMILAALVDPWVGWEEFDMFKYSVKGSKLIVNFSKQIRGLENSLLDKPVKQAQVKMEYALGKRKWTTEELIKATKAIDYKQLQKYSVNPYANGSLLVYLHGSLDSKKSVQVYQNIIQKFGINHGYEPPYSRPQLPSTFVAGSSFVHRFMLANKMEVNSGLAFYLHTFDKKAPSTEPYTRMTLHLLKDAFLRKVRFGEKLGYDHNMDVFEGSVGGGLLITIQGEKDPIHMEICVEKILGELNKTLHEISDEEFKDRVSMYIAMSTINDRQSIEAKAYWDQIARGYRPTDKRFTLQMGYRKITRSGVIKFLFKYIFSSKHRRKLSIHAVSHRLDPQYSGELTWCGAPLQDLGHWRSNFVT